MTRDHKGVLVYLLLTFGVAWSLWFAFLPHLLPLGTPGWIKQAQLLGPLGAWVPMAAAFLVRKWVTREGFEDAGLSLNLKKRWPFYLTAALFPWIALGALVVLAQATGLAHPDFQIMDTKHSLLGPHDVFVHGVSSLVGYYAVISLIGSPFAFGEEFGWRGYLQMRLYPARPLLAALATGVIWGLWHAPGIILGGGLPGSRVAAFALLCGWATMMAIPTAWLRLRTGGVWAGCVLHSMSNSSVLVSVIIFYRSGAPLLIWGSGLLSMIPLGIFCAWIIATGGLKLPAWQPPEQPRQRRFDDAP